MMFEIRGERFRAREMVLIDTPGLTELEFVLVTRDRTRAFLVRMDPVRGCQVTQVNEEQLRELAHITGAAELGTALQGS